MLHEGRSAWVGVFAGVSRRVYVCVVHMLLGSTRKWVTVSYC